MCVYMYACWLCFLNILAHCFICMGMLLLPHAYYSLRFGFWVGGASWGTAPIRSRRDIMHRRVQDVTSLIDLVLELDQLDPTLSKPGVIRSNDLG